MHSNIDTKIFELSASSMPLAIIEERIVPYYQQLRNIISGLNLSMEVNFWEIIDANHPVQWMLQFRRSMHKTTSGAGRY